MEPQPQGWTGVWDRRMRASVPPGQACRNAPSQAYLQSDHNVTE